MRLLNAYYMSFTIAEMSLNLALGCLAATAKRELHPGKIIHPKTGKFCLFVYIIRPNVFDFLLMTELLN